LASRDPDSDPVHHLSVARLHLSRTPANIFRLIKTDVSWLILVLGSLATFRLSHLMTKERGPLAMFERIRNAMPGGRGSAKEWITCIWCFSLTASALVCLILWAGGLQLTWDYWILHWLSFSSLSLLVNHVCK
jgi:hypothetical protein